MSRDISFDEYQKLAGRTAMYPGRDEPALAPYPALGLAGEAGEVCEHIKKAIRDDGGEITDERRRALRKELGDVLWYVAALSSELGLQMGDIARANVEKLADRQKRGVIHGEGDDR
ncbi:MAG: nucleoside triphosphate pyrophosphohydrolase family protein [Persicimonas sp.]